MIKKDELQKKFKYVVEKKIIEYDAFLNCFILTDQKVGFNNEKEETIYDIKLSKTIKELLNEGKIVLR